MCGSRGGGCARGCGHSTRAAKQAALVERSRLIRVSRNRIAVVPASIGNAHMLQELSISENLLDELPDALFTLAALRVLDARRNRLLRLPETLGECRALQKLFLSHNRLAKLPASVDYARLDALRSLALRENHLTKLPRAFSGLPRLQTLDVAHNRLTAWEHPVVLPALTFLDVSFNQLAVLPPVDCPALTVLRASNNPLAALPEWPQHLAALATLDLDDCPFEATAPAVEPPPPAYHALEQLSLSRCGVASLPAVFSTLQRLRQLTLLGNELAALPQLRACTALTSVDLSDNCLVDVDCAALPASLVDLNLGGNRLEQLGKPQHHLDCVAGLRKLSLSSNGLVCLYAPGLASLTALRVLALDGNHLPALDGVEALHGLEELDVSSNELELLPTGFGRLTNLRVLRLNNNSLRDLPVSMLRCQQLTNVYLEDNPFSDIPKSVKRVAQDLLNHVAQRAKK